MQLWQAITAQNNQLVNNLTTETNECKTKEEMSGTSKNLGKNKKKQKNKLDIDFKTKTPIKIFVGGVPPNLSEGHLRQLFKAEFLKIAEVKDKFKILSACCFKGFGFINILGLDKSQVEEALQKINLVYNSRKFITRVAIDSLIAQETKQKKKDYKLLVKNLSENITHIELHEYFSQFGKLDNTYAAFDTETGKHKGFGFVIF